MGVLWARHRSPASPSLEAHAPAARRCRLAGAAMEGKETRFGDAGVGAVRRPRPPAPRPARSTRSTTRSPRSAAVLLIFNMLLGEVAPGGVGSGLYGILVLAIIDGVRRRADGRPHAGVPGQEDRRARDQARRALHPDHAGCSCWSAPGSRWRCHGTEDVDAQRRARTGSPRCCTPSPRRPTTTARAFAGLTANTASTTPRSAWPCCSAGSCRSSLVLALAGSLARQQPVPATAGTLPTHRPLFVGDARRRRRSSSPA